MASDDFLIPRNIDDYITEGTLPVGLIVNDPLYSYYTLRRICFMIPVTCSGYAMFLMVGDAMFKELELINDSIRIILII